MFSNESARKRRLKVNNTILPTAGSIMDPAANHYRVCDYLALTFGTWTRGERLLFGSILIFPIVTLLNVLPLKKIISIIVFLAFLC